MLEEIIVEDAQEVGGKEGCPVFGSGVHGMGRRLGAKVGKRNDNLFASRPLPLGGSTLMVLMPERTAAELGVESDNIDEGCQRTRRERHCRLREVT